MEDNEECSMLDRLPPLPAPDLRRMRMQASSGCTLVMSIIASCIGASHFGTSYMVGWASDGAIVACHGLVYVEAFTAIVCLLGLMWCDPGVVRRSERTCSPLPAQVAERLRSGESLQQIENIVQDGITYCVRCLLWRLPADARSPLEACACLPARSNRIHHCSTCQHCVENFDHHCGVFGRCIAGQGLAGSMGYFKVIIAAGNLGALSAMCILCVGLSRSGDLGYWVGMLFAGYVSLLLLGWCFAVLAWQLTRVLSRSPRWDLFRFGRRSAGWNRFQPIGGAGSDIDASPVDPVIIGLRR